ncbi:hypothetical protein [Corynebacterium freneyi]|uniref:Uncharacterized protein n=1 Tax=Corynebacterium freneyi TaxID=134034 RepID=A0ABS4U9X4_9CORY|nr:hypothetical protein [Corynebacterium freneyi]MBP2333304.1 hypothetical protein [Corynebacterium freneyi]QXA52644.1 hypothetical protein I6L56_11460 [Corynebacterium freneyi]WJZ04592.1 hypothetical protein CFREN_03030 [Corynebacterium freneyi]
MHVANHPATPILYGIWAAGRVRRYDIDALAEGCHDLVGALAHVLRTGDRDAVNRCIARGELSIDILMLALAHDANRADTEA